MGLTTDKLRSMVKKWQTLIEANCDVKTTDGYTLRLFCIGFTRKQEMSTKKTAYAQAGQVTSSTKKTLLTNTTNSQIRLNSVFFKSQLIR